MKTVRRMKTRNCLHIWENNRQTRKMPLCTPKTNWTKKVLYCSVYDGDYFNCLHYSVLFCTPMNSSCCSHNYYQYLYSHSSPNKKHISLPPHTTHSYAILHSSHLLSTLLLSTLNLYRTLQARRLRTERMTSQVSELTHGCPLSEDQWTIKDQQWKRETEREQWGTGCWMAQGHRSWLDETDTWR